MPSSSSSPSTIYLVTGANRGLGFGLVAEIASTHEDAFVYAGVRDPAKAAALDELSTKYPGRIAVVKCVSGDAEGNAALEKEIEARHGRVDTVIANAGISRIVGTALETAPSVFEEQFAVNVLGPVVLFQSLHALLKASVVPRFVPISTGAASIGGRFISINGTGTIGYGASKAALNYATRKIHFENEWLTAFPLAPGPVITDMMGDSLTKDPDGVFAKLFEGRAKTVEQASAALIAIINASTREKDGGEFYNVDGTKLPW